jgi:hypothetical protein
MNYKELYCIDNKCGTHKFNLTIGKKYNLKHIIIANVACVDDDGGK